MCDIELGRQVGATTFQVRTGRGAKVADEYLTVSNYVVDDLRYAAQVIERLVAANLLDEHGKNMR